MEMQLTDNDSAFENTEYKNIKTNLKLIKNDIGSQTKKYNLNII